METKSASDKLNTVRLKGKWVVCTEHFTSYNIFVFTESFIYHS